MIAQVGITGDVGDGSKRSERGHRPFCLSGAAAGEGQRRRRGVSDGGLLQGRGQAWKAGRRAERGRRMAEPEAAVSEFRALWEAGRTGWK